MHFVKKPVPGASVYAIPRYVRGMREAISVMNPIFVDRSEELLVVLHVSEDLELLQFSCHRGGDCSVLLPLKKIVSDSAEFSTNGLILAHNHPSGDSNPSADDLLMTKRLANLVGGVDVTLLDHLIYGDGEWTSLRQRGLI